MKIVTMNIEKLLPAGYNPRKDLQPGDKEYEKIKRSITEFGYVDPVIWNERTGRIVGGHQRLKVLQEMGITQVDVSVVDLDEAKEKALNIALNKISGEWDLPKLKDLLEELDASGMFDIEITGFDLDEIDDLMAQFRVDSEIIEDEAPDLPEDPITKTGDLWVLGRHRLLCGDATSAEDVSMLMAGQKADLVLTDPPYNVDYEGGTANKLKIQNDKMKDEQFLQFLIDSFKQMYEHSKKGAAIYVFHADSEGYNFRTAFKKADYSLRQCLIWVKNSLVMGRQDYQWKHEPILYGWKDGASHAWYADRKQTTLIEFDRPQKSAEHPTMKPVGLCGYFIKNSSKGGDIVLDLFGGSGTTLIACEQLNRTCYTQELDPRYCDVIVQRFENLTGKKAVLAER